MNVPIKPLIVALAVPTLTAMFSAGAQADEPQCFFESRSGDSVECAIYHSEISNTRAFLETVVNRGKWMRPSKRAVIIDVRSTPEYKAGHPEHAYNVPYPFIYQECTAAGRTVDGACKSGKVSEIAQDPEAFKQYVESIIPNKDTPIYTMCRTGVRSVAAANRLTEAGYTNVRNMWEGFVGINLKAPFDLDDDPATPTVELPVDLNHDGLLTDADKNGWLYHQGLPVDKRLLPKLIYQPRADLY